MANITQPKIYTYVRSRIKGFFPDAYVTGTYEPIPQEGLAVMVREVEHYTPVRSVDLDYSQDVNRTTYEVQVFSNLFEGGKDKVYEVMEVVQKAFQEMYFIQRSCVPVERVDNRVNRLAARFERTICGGDELPGEVSQ